MRGRTIWVLVMLLPGGLLAGDVSVIEDVSYPDDAAARVAWKPMAETAPVSVAEKDGVRALKMPCNFKGTRIDRASWDRSVQLNLAFCLGIQFRFFCADTSPVSHFSLYFQSGDGWYCTSFAPERTGAWCTVRM